ncbi:hypothetical protein [Methylocaldum sp.]|uniref:hypothetical protein n=1 Tax=Methylocaldum sp. TaxID=1969727 RepID=UPI002D72B384|nr:hypothetical protein [Methylocaldum sp.]HYE38253.1 hypothetical protein [Methylocaldum sp.]
MADLQGIRERAGWLAVFAETSFQSKDDKDRILQCADQDIPALLEEVERLRAERLSRFYRTHRVKGHSHSTACTIWGDDGQGTTREGWTQRASGEGLPCNCGALENYQRSRAEAAEAQVSRLREGLEALVGEPNEGGEMVWFDHEWQRFRDVARSLLSTMEPRNQEFSPVAGASPSLANEPATDREVGE